MALLERLRQEVVSLASASHEGLLAVSIEALERDLAGRGTEADTLDSSPGMSVVPGTTRVAGRHCDRGGICPS